MARVQWRRLLDRPILIVSGKGGTGKSTVAAAVATFAAASGRRTLLAEMEGRGEISQTLAVEDPGFHEREAPAGFAVLSITPYPAALEYLHLYVGLDRVGRTLLRSGALDQLIGAAPGFRDLLSCGKLYELTNVRRTHPRDRGRPLYDLVVVDAPPTGQLESLLRAPSTFAELIRVGRMKRQAVAIGRMLQDRASVALVAVPEEMAVAETLEALPMLRRTGIPLAAIVANRCLEPVAPPGLASQFHRLTPDRLAAVFGAEGGDASRWNPDGLVSQARTADARRRFQQGFLRTLRAEAPTLRIPDLHRDRAAELVGAMAAVMEGTTSRGEGRPKPLAPPRRRRGRPPGWPREASLAPHLGDARIILVCGSGGVGKTTVAAALAVRFSQSGRRTLLLTVDPARRLATALRLPAVGGQPVAVPVGRHRVLHAVQLDTARTFDDLVRRHAGSAERRERILDNPFYRRIADTLSGTHEYMAMEKLFELSGEDRWDRIVLDTPPTRSALSFLDAPRRLTDFLGGRPLRLILWPTARAGRMSMGVARWGAAAFARAAGRIVGTEALSDAVEFLHAFEGMYGGFKERAARAVRLLASSQCAFLVVTAPGPRSLDEAAFFVRRLDWGGMRLAAVVANRSHPHALPLPSGAAKAAGRLLEGSPEDRAAGAVLSHALAEEPRRRAETESIAAFSAAHPAVSIVAVPELGGDVHDVPGLERVAAELFGGPAG